MNRQEWSKNLYEELDKVIDNACEYVGKTELTKEEIKHWFLPLVKNLSEAQSELFLFQIPESIEEEESNE